MGVVVWCGHFRFQELLRLGQGLPHSRPLVGDAAAHEAPMNRFLPTLPTHLHTRHRLEMDLDAVFSKAFPLLHARGDETASASALQQLFLHCLQAHPPTLRPLPDAAAEPPPSLHGRQASTASVDSSISTSTTSSSNSMASPPPQKKRKQVVEEKEEEGGEKKEKRTRGTTTPGKSKKRIPMA